MLNIEKRDLFINGKCKTIRIAVPVWNAFVALAGARGLSLNTLAGMAQRDHNGTMAEAIEAYVRKHSGPVFLAPSRDTWLGGIINVMRPVFAARGHVIPEKIRATVGFPSTGMRGKRIAECWSPEATADGHTEIFIHPTLTDPVTIVNWLTHELCHAVDGCKNGHGKKWTKIAHDMDITVGKGTHALGGDAWKVWALPIIEAAGPMPHSAMAEAAKKVKKQTNRQLKCECPDCGTIWRMSKKAMDDIAKKQAGRDDEINPRAFMNCVDPDCTGKVALAVEGDEEE